MSRRNFDEVVGFDNVFAPGGRPIVVSPGSVEETAEVVRRAHEAGLTVAARGGGTRSDPVHRDPPPHVVVETDRMSGIVEHSPADLVATARLGTRMMILTHQLARRGQRLPLDPAYERESTVGGVLATNAFGPLRLTGGPARDRVIGMTLVRFDGKVVRTGGKVVKNVSGYDLGKLYLGSWGAFGILVEASFKLAPIPRAEGSLRLGPRSRREALSIVTEVLRGPFPLAAAVWEDGKLTLHFEGLPAILEDQARAAAAAADVWIAPAWASGPAWQPAPERKRRKEIELAPLILRLSCVPTAWPTVMESVLAFLPEPVRERSLPGAGVTWLSFPRPPAREETRRLVWEIRAALVEYGGHAIVERMPPPFEDVVPRWGVRDAEWKLSAALKEALDPDETFPPLPAGPLEAAS